MYKELFIIRLFVQFRIYFSLVLYSILTIHLSAQQYGFKTYNRSSGLPSDYINCIYQDRSGYLWFGTDQGATRYDGKSFITFNSSNGLNNNFILKIYQDHSGSIWFGLHEGGVTKYNGQTFHTYCNKEGTVSNSVKNILEDKFGRLYFDDDDGIEIFYGNNFSSFKLGNQHRMLALLKDGSILIKDSLLYRRIIPTDDLTMKTVELVVPKEVDAIFKPNFGPLGAFVRSNGNVCLFGMLGFVELKNVEYNKPTVERKLNDISIESVTEDMEGRIWCGTESKGILCLENDKHTYINCVVKKTIQDRISSAFCDYEGNLWFGTMGSGAQKFLGSHIQIFNSINGLSNDDVTVIYEDRFNNVWLGMRTGISVISKNNIIPLEKFITIKEVRCFAEDVNGNIYIGTFDPMYGPTSLSKILSKQKLKNWIIPYGVASILVDNKNSIWISTYGGGTYQYFNHTFKHYKISDGLASNMIEKTVLINNSIWFLSKNNGASKYINNRFINFSKVNGLPSNAIYDVYEDEYNTLFGTDIGLVQLKGKKLTTYSVKDGLIGNKVLAVFPSNDSKEYWVVTNESLYKFKNDSLIRLGNTSILPFHDASVNNVYHHRGSSIVWLATTEGAIKIDLTKVRTTKHPPKVEIVNAYADTTHFYNSVHNAYFFSNDTITTLNYTQNDITINFCALSFTNEEKVKYIYKMKGFDDNWSKPTSENKVRYRNLNPGEFTFYVYAINGDGIYSTKAAQITFIITPPFWKTMWFILGTSLLLLSILISTIRLYSTKKLRAKINSLEQEKKIREERDKTREQISRDLHDDISSTLGSIALYSESLKRQSPELSENQKHMLDKIGALSSEAIDHLSDIIWSVTPEHDTLNDMLLRMKNYMVELCSVNRLEYEINVEEIKENVSINEEVRRNIFLIYKEALHNIIKHAGAAKVILIIKYLDKIFEMTIIDNGKGFDLETINASKNKERLTASSGHGINNMKKRAEEIKAELKFESSSDKGTKITLINRMT